MKKEKYNVAIIGDNFMLNQEFESALKEVESYLNIKHLNVGWPDEPMIGAGQEAGLYGLKEYVGDFEEVTTFLKDVEILINHVAPITRNMLEKLPKLKFISVARGGPVNIDVKSCEERGIVVKCVPGRNASAVAEFTLGAILAQTRLITIGDTLLKEGTWEHRLYRYDMVGTELKSQNVGIIGYGEIGKLVVDYLLPICSNIWVCDPYVQLLQKHLDRGVRQVKLNELLQNSDVVSLHARVTGETTLMINQKTISEMKKGVYFINTARGPLVNYTDLKKALDTGYIRGVALDTFEKEPLLKNDSLLNSKYVTLTPHIAGASIDTVKYAAKKSAENVKMYLKS